MSGVTGGVTGGVGRRWAGDIFTAWWLILMSNVQKTGERRRGNGGGRKEDCWLTWLWFYEYYRMGM